jgi:hypothetical protein
LGTTCQRCLHILGPHKLTMLMSSFQMTCKQFHDIATFSSVLFSACMSLMSIYFGSLQKSESNEATFSDMQDVSIFSNVYF